MAKTNVLFLCTGNSARSLMAEALLRKHAGDRFEAFSAGLHPVGVNPVTERVLREIGIDTGGLRSKPFREYMGKMHFGYLITVCTEAEKNCPSTFPDISRRLSWSFEDPAAFTGTEEEKLAKFRQIRDEIDTRIRAWLQETSG
jgi:arsenate reductase